MSRQTLDAGPAPLVTVADTAGDLQVRGWETEQISLQADADDLQVDHLEDRLQITSRGDLDLRLPHQTNLTIGSVAGDAGIKFLEDGLIIGAVHGSLDLRHVAGCQVDAVYGDLNVKHAAENVRVGQVYGNADARHISGDCDFEQVNGNLDLQDIAGNIRADARGTARLRLQDLSGSEYQVRAGGNLYCYLPPDAGLRIRMESGENVIKVRTLDGSNTYRQANHELLLGEGEASMALLSGGSIYLFIDHPGWGDPDPAKSGFGLHEDFGMQIAQQVEAQIESQMADVTRRISEQMDELSERLGRAGFSQAETEKIIERARQTGDRESARAQEKMRRAQEKLERKLESHRRRAEQHNPAATDRRTRRQGWGFNWPAPPPPPAPPKPAASEEERLMILRMLEQKKISLDEADRLLTALEGG